MLSLVTGLVFVLLLTRNMTIEQYGVWSNIFDIVAYFTLISGLFPFWATRFVARGKEGAAKTSISANLIVGLMSSVVYLILIFPITSALNIGVGYLIFYVIAVIQVVAIFLVNVFEGCLRAVRPQATGYGLLIQDVAKILTAYVVFLGLGQLFLGAMLGIIVGTVVQVIFYWWLLAGELRQKIHWGYLKEWFKGSPAFIYNAVGMQIASFVFILLFIYGGQAARGEYQAASTFSVIVSYASSMAFALYPKMLAGECREDVATSFTNILMLALPMATIAIVMSQSLLIVLNVTYGSSWPILVLLTVDALVSLASTFYTQCLMGIETFDIEGKISVRQLLKSKIFKVFTLPYIQAAIALPATYLVLTRVLFVDSVHAVSYVVAISIIVHVVTFIALYLFMHKEIKLMVIWGSVAKYAFSSIVIAAVLYFTPQTTTLLATIGKAIAGAGIYVAILLAIDKNARLLITQIWEEIRSILHF